MNIAVIIINIGKLPYAKYTLNANKRYYSTFGIPVYEINEIPNFMNTEKPKWVASMVYSIFENKNFDFVIVQDADILPCNTRLNIIDFLMFDYINLAVDTTRIGKHRTEAPFPHFRYNAGLIGYSRKQKEFFENIFNKCKDDPDEFGTCDQYYINKFLWEKKIFVNEIPQIFNAFYCSDFDYNKNIFCHYTNYMNNEDKIDYIVKYHPQEMII